MISEAAVLWHERVDPWVCFRRTKSMKTSAAPNPHPHFAPLWLPGHPPPPPRGPRRGHLGMVPCGAPRLRAAACAASSGGTPGGVFAQRVHSAGTAPIITVIIQVTTLKTTHLRNHAQSIQNSKIQTSDACHGSQGPKFCPL